MKRVTSSFWMENCCQLMIAPGVFVTDSVLPLVANVALPEATVPPVGLANAVEPDAANAAPMASETMRRRCGNRLAVDALRRCHCDPGRRELRTPLPPPIVGLPNEIVFWMLRPIPERNEVVHHSANIRRHVLFRIQNDA